MYRFGNIEFFAENMHHRSFFYTNNSGLKINCLLYRSRIFYKFSKTIALSFLMSKILLTKTYPRTFTSGLMHFENFFACSLHKTGLVFTFSPWENVSVSVFSKRKRIYANPREKFFKYSVSDNLRNFNFHVTMQILAYRFIIFASQ